MESLASVVTGSNVPQLPTEVMKAILDLVVIPEELATCGRVCDQWSEILEPRKPEYYFTLVVPFLLPYFDNRDILTCMKVSKSWNKSIDEAMSKLADDCDTNIRLNKPRIMNFVGGASIGRVNNNLVLLNKVIGMTATPVNLLFFRCLNLTYHIPEEDIEDNRDWVSLEKIAAYLEKYGSLVQKFNITLASFDETNALMDFSGILQTWLQKTPNLKSIEVSLRILYILKPHLGLFEELSLLVLPQLSNLTKITYRSDIVEILDWFMKSYGSQVEEVSTCGNLIRQPSLDLPGGVRLGRLNKICIGIESLEEAYRWKRFMMLQDPPIQKLAICCVYKVDQAIADVVVEIVNSSSLLLKELRIDYLEGAFGNLKFGGLNGLFIPNAKIIKFIGIGSPTPQLLASVAPALQDLQLSFSFESFGSHYGHLYDYDRFWELLASVKKVKVLNATLLFPPPAVVRTDDRYVYWRSVYEKNRLNIN